MLLRKRVLVALSVVILAGALIASGIAVAEAPANDDFDFATEIILVDGVYTDDVDMTEASRAGDDPDAGYCGFDSSLGNTWYWYEPTADQYLMLLTEFSDYSAGVIVYTGGRGALNLVYCASPWENNYLNVEAGQRYYFMVQFTGGYNGYGSDIDGTIHLQIQEILPPPNDNFANATPIEAIPYSDDINLLGATRESGEPTGTCVWEEGRPTVWYAFTPPQSGYYSVNLGDAYPWWIVLYQGTALNDLQELGCRSVWSDLATFGGLEGGETYFIQVSAESSTNSQAAFYLDVPPPPFVDFEWWPYEPSIYSETNFSSYAYDPANVGITYLSWDLGDGTVVEGEDQYYVNHRYATDGDYEVFLTTTTADGRSASAGKTVQVRTHDVGISVFKVPSTGKPNQTRTIAIGLSNQRYGERVNVYLYKSNAYGDYETIAAQYDLALPVLKGKRRATGLVTFRYTFTPQDAALGKVTFRARVEIIDHNDAYWPDNEAISLPVRVLK